MMDSRSQLVQKRTILYICVVILSLTCLSAIGLEYYRLGSVPYGFHVDEMSSSVDIGCMATEGIDAHHVSYPLFSSLNYGTPKPPTYIYPAMLWARVFGYSVTSLRALSVTVHVLGIIGLFFLARLFLGWRYALLTTAIASISPWVWGLSRVAFESLFAATFLIWGLYLFLKSPKIIYTFLSGLFFAAAIYAYPPFRLQTPLMIVSLVILSRSLYPRSIQSWLVLAFTVLIPIIPLVQKTLSGEIQQRFNSISIFSRPYLISIHAQGHLQDILGILINNFLLHFSWDFLFLKGDPSYVHSTRHFGILSWLDGLALLLALFWALMLLFRKLLNNNPLYAHKTFIFFLLANIFIGFLPAALTNSELPNSLRITGAWPFVSLLSGFMLWQACERWWVFWALTSVLAVLFAMVYFNVYFKTFPQEGKGMFSYWTLEEANGLKTDQDWLKFVMLYRYQDYNARYFLMQYKHLSCTQSQNMWQGVNAFLTSRGIN